MKFTTTLLAAALAVLPAVRAHGTVSLFVANGKTYSAPDAAEGNPFKKTPTPVRQLELLEPITDLNSNDMICGRGTPPKASEVASIAAGSEFSFKMRGGSGAPWPHDKGPVMFYLAQCPGSADECDQSNLKWFKIDEKGLRGQNSWYQEDLQQGKAVSGTIPSDLKSGDYLLRIEILAIHNAMRVGGAETSVSCTQLHVTGGGSAVPSASDLVTFPGAYKATDPGILVDIWNNFTSYDFPGPAVFKASGSGS
ncbi:glycoside hydrolase, partial [Exidia glandulosa HHB12029]